MFANWICAFHFILIVLLHNAVRKFGTFYAPPGITASLRNERLYYGKYSDETIRWIDEWGADRRRSAVTEVAVAATQSTIQYNSDVVNIVL